MPSFAVRAVTFFQKSEFENFLASGSQPVSFYVKVKDYIDKVEENHYPLRPIASSIDTLHVKLTS